ncbi:hypothetical protein F5Y03DRAFT_365117 [Xylaria venustula]|nr:hypothetical protein F5Y03DRAFT_365117 [Xylaria venustula]
MTCASRVVGEQTGLEVEGEDIIRTTENVIEGEHYVILFVFCGFPDDKKQLSTENNPELTDWRWSTHIQQDAVKESRGKKPGKPVFAPLVSLYDKGETRCIDWDREPGITIRATGINIVVCIVTRSGRL